MSIRVGIVGISGFGGGEAMRLVASHPSFELIYAAGEGSAGSRLVDRLRIARGIQRTEPFPAFCLRLGIVQDACPVRVWSIVSRAWGHFAAALPSIRRASETPRFGPFLYPSAKPREAGTQ
jgi:Semialdehyde dehydrogenase, NAD binding domain